VAVPGEMMGLWTAHQRFGVLPWRSLFTEPIRICREGVLVTDRLARTFANLEDKLSASKSLRQILMPDGRIPKIGDR
jgi:gamma-glutamyltranspeptidase